MNPLFTFISGNQEKVDQLKRHLDLSFEVKKLDLTEIQSLDSKEIVTYKAKEAYQLLKSPVLVEDTSLVFNALGKLPGPYIKWFAQELGHIGLCRILDPFKDRSAFYEVNFAYYDGIEIKIFSAGMEGAIAMYPKGVMGMGWDPIFIQKGQTLTQSEITLELYDSTSPRRSAVLKLKSYLNNINGY